MEKKMKSTFWYWEKDIIFFVLEKVCWVDITFKRKANLTELDYVQRILLSQRLSIHSK